MLFRIIIILALASVPFILMLQTIRRRPAIAGGPAHPFNSALERLAYYAMLMGLATVAITGLLSALILDKLSGYTLMLHVSGAPLFALGLAALAVMWGDRHTLSSFWNRRLPFWMMLAFGMVVISTGVLPMMYFSTHQQHFLIDLHKYCGVGVLVFAIVHFVRLHQK